jgi:hypothetical protein
MFSRNKDDREPRFRLALQPSTAQVPLIVRLKPDVLQPFVYNLEVGGCPRGQRNDGAIASSLSVVALLNRNEVVVA